MKKPKNKSIGHFSSNSNNKNKNQKIFFNNNTTKNTSSTNTNNNISGKINIVAHSCLIASNIYNLKKTCIKLYITMQPNTAEIKSTILRNMPIWDFTSISGLESIVCIYIFSRFKYLNVNF